MPIFIYEASYIDKFTKELHKFSSSNEKQVRTIYNIWEESSKRYNDIENLMFKKYVFDSKKNKYIECED